MRKMMLRISKLAPAALLALGLLVAGEARAERACEKPASETGRVCPVAVCIALQDEVNRLCKTPAPTSCRRISGCAALQAMRARWVACRDSRVEIRSVCFPAGEPGHDLQITMRNGNIADCDARIALPEPVGCADPCPGS